MQKRHKFHKLVPFLHFALFLSLHFLVFPNAPHILLTRIGCCLDTIEAEFSDGFLSFHIDELQSLNILLIAEADWLDRLAENL